MCCHMDVSKNRGIPKSSILIGFSIINHPFSGTSIFGNPHILVLFSYNLKKWLVLVPQEEFEVRVGAKMWVSIEKDNMQRLCCYV